MKSLKEISEKLNCKEEDVSVDKESFKEISAQLAETDISKMAQEKLGKNLLAISLIKKPTKDSEEDEIPEQEASPMLLFLMTNIVVTDNVIQNFIENSSDFDPKCPENCLITKYLLEEFRLLAKQEITDDDLRSLFFNMSCVLKRDDLKDRVRFFFNNKIVSYGRNEEAYVAAKKSEMIEKQTNIDTRSFYANGKDLFLNAEINDRNAILDSILSRLKEKYSHKIQSLELLEIAMVHMDNFKSKIFRTGNAEFVEEIAEYRLFDKGLIIRLLAAAKHLEMSLEQFEQYFIGYAICGSWATSGYDTRRDSDLDILMLIDDLDVNEFKMSRNELYKKISLVVEKFASKASTMVGLPSNALHPTTFLLSDSYRKYYQGNAVLFSMIDGAFVIQDLKGILRSWQILLKDGSIDISPSERYTEALLDRSRINIFYPYKRIRTIFTEDLYPGLLAGAQSLLIRLGEVILPPNKVVEKLNKVIDRADISAPKEGFSHLAWTLQELINIYRGFKQKPNMEISVEHLGKMMDASEKAFNFIEEVVENLKSKQNTSSGK